MGRKLKKLPSLSYLHERLIMDGSTGELVWKHRPLEHFKDNRSWNTWNSKYAGHVAGHHKPDGYWTVRIDDIAYFRHRIVWKMFMRAEPEDTIDHRDGVPGNDGIHNLRVVAHAVNQRNQKKRNTNTSGVTGVYWKKARNKWAAQICFDGRAIPLGTFTDKSDAIAARSEAERVYGFSERHGT